MYITKESFINEQSISNGHISIISFLVILLIAFIILFCIIQMKDEDFSPGTLIITSVTIMFGAFFVTIAVHLYFVEKQTDKIEQHIENNTETATVTLDFIDDDSHAYLTDQKEPNVFDISTLDTSQKSLIHKIDRETKEENRQFKIKYAKYRDDYILTDIKPK